MLSAIADAVSNTVKLAEEQVSKYTNDLTNLVAGPALGLLQPRPGLYDLVKPGILDWIKLPEKLIPKGGDVDSSFQGMLDTIGGLGGEIDDLKQQLQNPDLTADQRMELSFKMQEKMQERMQMITMLTNLMKSEHDAQMAIVNNFRV